MFHYNKTVPPIDLPLQGVSKEFQMRKLLRKTKLLLLLVSSILFLILLFNPPEQATKPPSIYIPPHNLDEVTPPNHAVSNATPPRFFVCPFKLPSSARLGNDLFVFGSLYGLARKFGGRVLIPETYASRLGKYFKLSTIISNFPPETPLSWLPRGLMERRMGVANDADVMCGNEWKRFTLERWASGFDHQVVKWLRSKLASIKRKSIKNHSKEKIKLEKNNSKKNSEFLSLQPPVPIFGVGRYLQSFKYFEQFKVDLLKDELAFHDWLSRRASRIIQLARLRNSPMTNQLSTIGVHIRRRDMADRGRFKQGYTVASEEYFMEAINFYTRRFLNRSFLFIVATDDLDWSRKHFRPSGHPVVFTSDFVDINFLELHDTKDSGNLKNAPFKNNSNIRLEIQEEELKMKFSDVDSLHSILDLAILSLTDHVILSVGSYGWWGAYLSNSSKRNVVYFSNYPLPNSEIASTFISSDYYPPSWISIP